MIDPYEPNIDRIDTDEAFRRQREEQLRQERERLRQQEEERLRRQDEGSQRQCFQTEPTKTQHRP